MQSDPCNLIVNYIPTPVTDDELRRLFEPFGTIESARVILDRVTHHPKGYGFVKYTTPEAARKAIEAMNGYEINNKRLRVMRANGPQNRSIDKYSERVVQLQPQGQAGDAVPFTFVGTGVPGVYTPSALPAVYVPQHYYVAAPQILTAPPPPPPQAQQQPIIIEINGQPLQLVSQDGTLPPPLARYVQQQQQQQAPPPPAPASFAEPVMPLRFVPFKAGNPESDPTMKSSFQLSVGQGSSVNSANVFDPSGAGARLQ